MLLAIIKLVEVLARAGFTVGIIFALPHAAAGRFGLAATLIGLMAFAFGWERYVDIQRRFIGTEAKHFDAAIVSMMRLWLINYAWMLPIFAALLYFWENFSSWVVVLILAIAVCEHIANTAYNIAVVEPRYRILLFCVIVKNLLLLIAAGFLVFVSPQHLAFDPVMEIWAAVSIGATLPLALLWSHIRKSPIRAIFELAGTDLWAQHRVSLTHFLTGLLAVLNIQFDRLVVGGLLPPDLAGVFFRHVMLVGFAYQFFNIAAYNRRLPQIFVAARESGVGAAQMLIARELTALGAVMALGFALLLWLDAQTAQEYTLRFSIAPNLLLLMLLAAFLRMAADFQALILNARFREKRVLRNQIATFIITAILLVTLALSNGIFGVALASAIGATTYLVLNVLAVRETARHQPEASK